MSQAEFFYKGINFAEIARLTTLSTKDYRTRKEPCKRCWMVGICREGSAQEDAWDAPSEADVDGAEGLS